MKTTQLFLVLRKCVRCVLLTATLGALTILKAESSAEVERCADEKAFAVMREMLVDFGYKEKVATINTEWLKMNTAKQWVAFSKEQFALTNSAVMTARLVALKAAAVSPERFAGMARNLQARHWNFDHIFAALCQLALTNAVINPKTDIQDEVRSMWGGMWLWTCKSVEPLPMFCAGGLGILKPTGHGRFDHGYDVVTLQKHYAQHFIGGGMFEAYFDLGRQAGVRKEDNNSDAGDYVDYNKVAVVTMGAQWVDVAMQGDTEHTRQWVELWASSRYTLSKSMPRLHWGSLAPGIHASPEEVEAVNDEVRAAITFPIDGLAPVAGLSKP